MVSPHSSECSSSIRGSNSLLLCGYNLDRSSMHGEGVTAVAWRTSAWHHCMSSRRAFAATSRALKIKQRREALAARVKIPRWAPPEAPFGEGPHQAAGHSDPADGSPSNHAASLPPNDRGGQWTFDPSSGAPDGLRPPDGIIASNQARALPTSVASTSTGNGIVVAGRPIEDSLVDQNGVPWSPPVISAELAAEVATGRRHVSMSHLPDGLQRIYEQYLDSKPLS